MYTGPGTHPQGEGVVAARECADITRVKSAYIPLPNERTANTPPSRVMQAYVTPVSFFVPVFATGWRLIRPLRESRLNTGIPEGRQIWTVVLKPSRTVGRVPPATNSSVSIYGPWVRFLVAGTSRYRVVCWVESHFSKANVCCGMKRPRLKEELAGRLEAIVDERDDVRNAEWLDFGEQLEILLDEVEARREDAAAREEQKLRQVAQGVIQEQRQKEQQRQDSIPESVLDQL